MRYHQNARTLSVGLSRLLRANPEVHAMLSQLSIIAPATGGLPVAYGICAALRAHQVYWAERECEGLPLHFRQYLELNPGENVILVDDILRSGAKCGRWWNRKGLTCWDWLWWSISPPRKPRTSDRCRFITWPS